jgi:hypothetical protein
MALRQLVTVAWIGLTFSGSWRQSDGDIDVTLRRYYEGAGLVYRECSVRVRAAIDYGEVEVACLLNRQQPVDVGGVRLLTRDELSTLRRLVSISALHEGGHAGADPRARQLALETLQIRCCTRTDVVVLVVSGNRTFLDDGPRHQLVQVLRKLETSLLAPDGTPAK